jgi:hypothetical protein
LPLLDRAKSFIARKASRLAVTALPLAALTAACIPHASATAVTFSNGTCEPSGSCSTGQQASVGTNPEANWQTLSGTLSLSTGSGGSLFVDGLASGSLTSSVPVSWSFTEQMGSFAYQLFFQLSGSGTFVSQFDVTGTAGPGQVISGNGSLPAIAGVYYWDMSLSGTCTSGPCSIDVPAASTLDLNSSTPASTSTVPEPATLFLMPSAGALLLLVRRRRKTRAT